jgi:hypothetical protein
MIGIPTQKSDFVGPRCPQLTVTGPLNPEIIAGIKYYEYWIYRSANGYLAVNSSVIPVGVVQYGYTGRSPSRFASPEVSGPMCEPDHSPVIRCPLCNEALWDRKSQWLR